MAKLRKLWVLKDSPPRWTDIARPEQLPPPEFVGGDVRTWYLRGGRGSGKTRATGEVFADLILRNEPGDWGIVAPAYGDARDVNIEGPSGLLKIMAPHIDLESHRPRTGFRGLEPSPGCGDMISDPLVTANLAPGGISPNALGLELRIGKVARENAPTKARRLLLEGRVMILRIDSTGCLADVRGDSGHVRRVVFGTARRMVLPVLCPWSLFAYPGRLHGGRGRRTGA